MGRNSRRIKERAEELRDGYQDARDEEFNARFKDFTSYYLMHGGPHGVTEDDVQDFIDGFDFPSEDTWVFTEVDNEIAEIADMKYQEWKERDI